MSAPRHIVIDVRPSEDDNELRFGVGVLVEPAASLGLRVTHYRLLEDAPMTWDEAEHLARQLNRNTMP